MSETYSTDELITHLNIHFYPSPTGNSGDDYRLAIIARLRAADSYKIKADALCEAAKLELLRIPSGRADDMTEYKIINAGDILRKAIADYEQGEVT
jgi:hypothetical protein